MLGQQRQQDKERRERERENNKALGVPANDAATCRRRAAARESRDPPKGSYIVSLSLSSIGCWHIVSSRRRTMGGLLYPVAQRAGGREGGRELGFSLKAEQVEVALSLARFRHDLHVN